MRILTLSNSPLVAAQGSGYVVLNYARGLKAKNHEVDLFGPESLEILSFLKKAKSHRISLGMLVRAVRQLLFKNYDILEFYGSESWLTAFVLYHLPRRRFLMVAHSNGLETQSRAATQKFLSLTDLDDGPPKWYQTFLKPPVSRAFTKVDGIVTVSDFDRRYALTNGYQVPQRVVAIENPLTNEYLGLTVDFRRPMVVGFCGSWLARKGIDIVQADIGQILRVFQNCRLRLIGVGREFRKESWFPPDVCDRVEVIPFVESKTELRGIYESLAILVMPSIYESFGLVAAEAMACGCAVAATRTGFSASLSDRKEAMLMEEPKSPFLYQCVRALLLDEEGRIRIAREGYARVQRLRWPEAIDALEATYTSWLEEFRSIPKAFQ